MTPVWSATRTPVTFFLKVLVESLSEELLLLSFVTHNTVYVSTWSIFHCWWMYCVAAVLPSSSFKEYPPWSICHCRWCAWWQVSCHRAQSCVKEDLSGMLQAGILSVECFARRLTHTAPNSPVLCTTYDALWALQILYCANSNRESGSNRL